MRMRAIFALAAVMLGTAVPAQAYRWLPSDGRSCVSVCTAADSAPIFSGLYQNGEPFSICRANAGREGTRPGYNLQPNWANACWVAYGGREHAIRRYECLCNR